MNALVALFVALLGATGCGSSTLPCDEAWAIRVECDAEPYSGRSEADKTCLADSLEECEAECVLQYYGELGCDTFEVGQSEDYNSCAQSCVPGLGGGAEDEEA